MLLVSFTPTGTTRRHLVPRKRTNGNDFCYLNRVLFKFYGADILLTRDSGLDGGTDTKILAALELGLEIVIVKKTKASTVLIVNNVNELLGWVDNNIPDKRQ